MPDSSAVDLPRSNPPIEFAVAVWIGMPDDELERGLREGWIRHPSAALSLTDGGQAIPVPPGPGDSEDGPAPLEIGPRADRPRIHALLRRLDATLDAGAFEAAWIEAGHSEAARADAFVGFLARTLNVSLARESVDQASGPALATLEAAAAGANGTARFRRLDALTGGELEDLARIDAGLRRALAAHERWALTDDRTLARLGDPEGRFDRFDRDTGEALLSDAWLGDRARHAAWRMAAARGRPLEVGGDGWRFVDRAAGDDATLELKGAGDHPVHQVIFARDDGDRVNGGASTDRIHGGRGDDVLRGRGGDDLIEGGVGDDILQGGSGRDRLFGQQGDDELDGGAGRDVVEGGGGNDDLGGGRGDDVLRGGAGSDVYRFEQGDGTDLIDDDGGAIFVDDVAIAGTMRRDGAGWCSADGRYRFSLGGDTESGATLTITASQGSDGDAGDTIRVLRWTPGAYGILLEGEDEASEVAPREAQGPGEDNESNGTSPASDSEQRAPPPASVLPSDSSDHDADARGDAVGDGDATSLGSASTMAEGHETGLSLLDWTTLAPDPLDEATLVDIAAVLRALDDGAMPAPPDIDAALRSETVGLTPANVADALADGSDAIDTEAGVASPFDVRRELEPERLSERVLIERPGLALRAIP